ncbi:Disulphide bond corrector protein DsbC [Noviherbaspirillum suwonense]|uniref:Disulphide bond corrector protein DsbC n=2 Tax=Noviherbaspirillum suwonense TaxID=1224511 RepID=A0ABY1QW67_9BURK|nr:Disulphide bond corrector protein DsbC [Noviherbaspirillum suwonense]
MFSAKKLTVLLGATLFFGALLHGHAQQSTPANPLKGASSLFASTNEDELLEPDQAFKLKVTVKGPNKVLAELTPAAGYYMYKDRIHFTVKDASGIKIKTVKLPTGDIKTDPNFGKMETYKKPIQAEITLDRLGQAKNFALVAAYQGCHEKLGVCYPPIDKTVALTLP